MSASIYHQPTSQGGMRNDLDGSRPHLLLSGDEASALCVLCLAAEDPVLAERLQSIAADVQRAYPEHIHAKALAELHSVWPRLFDFILSGGWTRRI